MGILRETKPNGRLNLRSQKQVLIEEITAAFDDVELEDGVTLSETYIIDDERINDRNHELRVKARAIDTEDRWQDILDAKMARTGRDVFIFMDAKGFRFYIPAYLRWYLRHMKNREMRPSTFGTIDIVLRGGIDESTEGIDEFYLQKFSLLSHRQSQAIAHFLEFAAIVRDEILNSIATIEEETIKAELAQGEITEEEAQERRQSLVEEMPNPLRQALKRYWGQFL